MSFNNRADMTLREQFESAQKTKNMDDYMKKAKPFDIGGSNGVPRVSSTSKVYPGRSVASPSNAYVHNIRYFTPPPSPLRSTPPPSSGANVKLASDCPFVPKNEYPRESSLVVMRTKSKDKSRSAPVVKASFGSQASKTLSEPVVKASFDSQATKIGKELVGDVESDKRDLISAMESVLNTLKVYEAKKLEASTARAQAEASVSSWKYWAKVIVTHLLLEDDAKKNNANLTDKAAEIQLHLLLLLRNEKNMFKILDEMLGNINLQLAQVEQEMKKANEINQHFEIDQNEAWNEDLSIKFIKERIQPLEVQAKTNNELQEALLHYGTETDILREELKTTRKAIENVKYDFEQRIRMLKCSTPRKTSVGMDSATSSQPSDGYTITKPASHSAIPSEDTLGCEQSEESESEGCDGEASVQESEDSDCDSDESSEACDCKCASVTECDPSDDSAEMYDDSEDSADESEISEDSEDSDSESDASEESHNSGGAKISNVEVSAAVTSQIVTVPSPADLSKAVSSENTFIYISAKTELHELPSETSPATSTDSTANITEAPNALRGDDWDLCGYSDSD